MRNLNYQLKQLSLRNRDGSFATQADRERLLFLFANQLNEAGYQHMRADSLRPKHVEALLSRWKDEAIGTGAIKNRMSALRWWAEKVGKENVVARSNRAYGIADRVLVTNKSKAKSLDVVCMARVTDAWAEKSLHLQGGLRIAARTKHQDHSHVGRQGRYVAPEGVLDQGWQVSRDPNYHCRTTRRARCCERAGQRRQSDTGTDAIPRPVEPF
jgi:hypothetical protein